MKIKRFLSIILVLAAIGSLSSCGFLKKILSSDLETEEEYALEEVSVEVPQPVKKKPQKTESSQKTKMDITLCDKDNLKLYEVIEKWYGTPYKMGGCTYSGVDCSCFVINVYEAVYNIKLSRRAMDMVNDIKLVDRKSLVEGDLVFFRNGNGNINHVGIYLKNDMFAHASTSKGVMVSKLTEKYWNSRFYKGGRHKNVSTKWQ